jgi:endonuclease YncB( thermonuclease family)
VLSGQAAKASLEAKLGSTSVRCQERGTDQYGRTLAVCFGSNGEDLNAWMVSQGQAVAYEQYSKDYVRQQEQARSTKQVSIGCDCCMSAGLKLEAGML